MKQLILCADDYGLSADISEIVRVLLQQQRLTATSVLASQPFYDNWHSDIALLAAMPAEFDVGLHFNLTEGHGLTSQFRCGFPSLKRWLLLSYTGIVDEDSVCQELCAQWDYLTEALGREPDYLDGHQHIHAFPGVRNAVYRFLASRNKTVWVRSVAAPWERGLFSKQNILNFLGAGNFAEALHSAGVPVNGSFYGLYNLQERDDYCSLFEGWLQQSGDHGLIMCHPGATGFRRQETEFLMGTAFPDLLKKLGVRLTPGHVCLFASAGRSRA